MLPEAIDDHAGQQVAGAVVDVGDPVGQRGAAVRGSRPGRRRRLPVLLGVRGGISTCRKPAGATPSFWSGSPRRRKWVAGRSRRPACAAGRPAGPRWRPAPSRSSASAAAWQCSCTPCLSFCHSGSSVRYQFSSVAVCSGVRFRGRRRQRLAERLAAGGPAARSSRRFGRCEATGAAGRCCGRSLLLNSSVKVSTVPPSKPTGFVELEDGGVVLAELRVDGPAGRDRVGVDGRRDAAGPSARTSPAG